MGLESKFDEAILQRYRKLFFPAIGGRIITGYNVYVDRGVGQAPFIINYLHSDLDVDENGRPHRHKQELLDVLKKSSDVKTGEQIVNSVVDRLAVYKIGEWDENPTGLKFYGADGNELQPEDLMIYRGTIIAEGRQFEMSVMVDGESDVKHVLNLFNKYTYKMKVDSRGEVKDENNPHAIFGAWEIPLIVVTAQNGLKRHDFRSISDIIVKDDDHEISTLVKKQRKRFEQFLSGKGVPFCRIRKYANRPFVEQYLDDEMNA